MNPYSLLRVLYGVFLGLAFVIGGILTSTSKGEPGVGFRIGYTYLSERARKKANNVTGIGLILLGVLFMLSSFFLPLCGMFVLLIGGVAVVLAIGYVVARREYELEDISREALEKPRKSIETPRLGKYLITQLVLAFLFLLMSPKLPRGMAFVLGSVMALIIGLTLLASRPLVFQLAPKFSGIMARGFAKALTLISALITFEAFLVWTGFENDVLGILLLPIFLLVIFYAAYVMLTSAYEEGYY
ncbi:SdpI family protein [Thermococcus peptonophilus]|uniref:SdpI family protein n=2 Tax=Thermococcus peptonophilus TaxID=53952 RepID=UPI000B0378E7|nr:SdpI family protein [Thermococcus peptonophilus]